MSRWQLAACVGMHSQPVMPCMFSGVIVLAAWTSVQPWQVRMYTYFGSTEVGVCEILCLNSRFNCGKGNVIDSSSLPQCNAAVQTHHH